MPTLVPSTFRVGFDRADVNISDTLDQHAAQGALVLPEFAMPNHIGISVLEALVYYLDSHAPFERDEDNAAHHMWQGLVCRDPDWREHTIRLSSDEVDYGVWTRRRVKAAIELPNQIAKMLHRITKGNSAVLPVRIVSPHGLPQNIDYPVRDLQEPLSAYPHELRVLFYAGSSPLVRP